MGGVVVMGGVGVGGGGGESPWSLALLAALSALCLSSLFSWASVCCLPSVSPSVSVSSLGDESVSDVHSVSVCDDSCSYASVSVSVSSPWNSVVSPSSSLSPPRVVAVPSFSVSPSGTARMSIEVSVSG